MPDPLPVDRVLPDVVRALERAGACVLVAPTGAGKTTRLPGFLEDSGLGPVVVLEPRRLAARAAAARVAHELGTNVGDLVGYQVRGDATVSRRTRIRFVTEGVLLRQMLGDPRLRGTSVLVFDEFHERHLYGDITLARALELQERERPDLKVVVMSATPAMNPASMSASIACPPAPVA